MITQQHFQSLEWMPDFDEVCSKAFPLIPDTGKATTSVKEVGILSWEKRLALGIILDAVAVVQTGRPKHYLKDCIRFFHDNDSGLAWWLHVLDCGHLEETIRDSFME